MERNKYELLLERLAYKHNKPVKVMKKIVESQFEFISRIKMNELDFNAVESKEEFESIKKNFNIKYLFVLHPSWAIINKLKQKKKNGEEESSSTES